MQDRRVKYIFSRDGFQWEVGGHKERNNEGEYGECVLYPYMKIEEWNLLKLFLEGREREERERRKGLNYISYSSKIYN
jgi:hypothetical protein